MNFYLLSILTFSNYITLISASILLDLNSTFCSISTLVVYIFNFKVVVEQNQPFNHYLSETTIE